MLEPLVVKATRAVPRREGRSNPPDLSNEGRQAIVSSYSTYFSNIKKNTTKSTYQKMGKLFKKNYNKRLRQNHNNNKVEGEND